MFAKNMHHLIILVIMGVTLLSSETSVSFQEPDPVGRLPEITVTAPRYDIRDGIYSGMLEEVIVTAQRPSTSINSIQSTETHFNNPTYLVVLLTFMLATLSILYMSLNAYVTAKERNHEGSRH
ncbi:MAG: hypothetical protein JSW02_09455 [candidate division WOR-3 bacterium]|nr:MAG: hypothetical protein JSW02_09455 [candidate division WOR-3 bacterium]